MKKSIKVDKHSTKLLQLKKRRIHKLLFGPPFHLKTIQKTFEANEIKNLSTDFLFCNLKAFLSFHFRNELLYFLSHFIKIRQ